MAKEFKKLIEIVKTGSSEEVRQAQRAIEQYLDDFDSKDNKKRGESLKVFLTEIEKFNLILDIDHQCYFINVLKWPFFYIGHEYFEEFSNFILECIQHPSGKIRQSIINATDWLMMSLRLDYIFYPQRMPTVEEKKRIIGDKFKLCHLVDKVGDLSDQYYLSKYGRIKYVSSLPVSEYKSIQKLLTEVLLPGESCERIYDDYLRAKNHDNAVANIEITLPSITLKYLKREVDGKKITYSDEICSRCGAKDIHIGATKYAFTNDPEIICEDCAIDEYQERYGFLSREVALARRRRIFDVGYLLQEIIIAKYLEQNNIDEYYKLDVDTMNFMGDLARRIYNENFSKEEKWELENEPDQKRIESKIREVLGNL